MRLALFSVALLFLPSFTARTVAPPRNSLPHPTPPSSEPSKAELVIQTGHESSVNSVAFSPDGRSLATGSSDGTVKLWDLATGRVIRTIGGPTAGVLSVAFSPDGRMLATGTGGAWDTAIKIWDVESGRELRTFAGNGYGCWVDAVAFSPDGRTLASGCRYVLVGEHDIHYIKLWDVGSGKELNTLDGHTDWVLSVAFSPDGHALVSGSRDKTIRIWDVKSGKELRTLTGHAAGVSSVAFSPDGRLVASGSDSFSRYNRPPDGKPGRHLEPSGDQDNTVKLWDVATGKEVRTLTGHQDTTTSVAFSPDGRFVAAGSKDKTVKLWEIDSGKETLTLTGHSAQVLSVAFGSDGKMLATGSADNSAKLWTADTGQELQTFAGHTSGIFYVSLSSDGHTLAAAGCDVSVFASQNRDSTIRLWDLAGGHYSRTLWGHTQPVCSVAFSPDGRTLASGSHDNTAKLWDVATGRELQSMHPLTGVGGVAFSPDGLVLASGTVGETIKLWDVASGKQLRTINGHSGGTYRVTFSPDGRLLASGGPRDTVEIWDAASWQSLHTLTGPISYIYSIAFSPDSHSLAWGGTKSIELWDVANGRELHAIGQHGAGPVVLGVAFSPDGSQLTSSASDSADNAVVVWDVASGRELRTLTGHTAEATSVAISPDGHWLYSGSRDGTIRIWDPRSGALTATLIAAREADNWVVVTPDGLFDGSKDGMEKLVAWRIGNILYSSDHFFVGHYTPGLLTQILAGQQLKPITDLASLTILPEVHITAPSPALQSSGMSRDASPEINPQRQISLSVSAPEYGAHGEIQFNGVVTTTQGKILRIAWDWGDGTSGSSWFPASHSYQNNGEYVVQTTAIRDDGQKATTQTRVSISTQTAAPSPNIMMLSSWLYLHVAQSAGHALYLGGSGRGGGNFGVYETESGKFSDLSHLLPPAWCPVSALAYGDNQLLVGGGMRGGCVGVFSAADGSFRDMTSRLQSQQSGLYYYGGIHAIGFNGRTFLIGGAGLRTSLESYSPKTDKFNYIPLSPYFAVNTIASDGESFLIAGAGPGPGPKQPPALGWISPEGSFTNLTEFLPAGWGTTWRSTYDGKEFFIQGVDGISGAHQMLALFELSKRASTDVTDVFPSSLNLHSIDGRNGHFWVGGEVNGKAYLARYSPGTPPTVLTSLLPEGARDVLAIQIVGNKSIAAGTSRTGSIFIVGIPEEPH